MTKNQKLVLAALYEGRKPPTKRNSVIAPLVQAALVEIIEYTPQRSARKIQLTTWGRVVVKKMVEDEAR